MNKCLEQFDYRTITLFRHYGDEAARIGLFLIFFWFGILKVFMVSPANPLVGQLLEVTFLSFIPPEVFFITWGVFEMLLGTMVLLPQIERVTFVLMLFHLATTVMPLFILTEVTWYSIFVPTLVGQYIIKNVALLSVGLLLFARLRPMTETHSLMGEEQEEQ